MKEVLDIGGAPAIVIDAKPEWDAGLLQGDRAETGWLSITQGGVIEVDTEQLRSLSGRVVRVGRDFEDAAEAVRRAQSQLWAWGEVRGLGGSHLAVIHEEVGRSAADAARVASDIMRVAEVFELVELRNSRDLAEAMGSSTATALAARVGEIEKADPDLAEVADELNAEWEHHRFDGLLGVGAGPAGLAALAALRAGVLSRVLMPGATLSGTAPAVKVEPVGKPASVSAPQRLDDAFDRFPDSGGAQVTVEKYTMADGTQQFAVYVKGTQAMGGDDPWNMASNMQLYDNEVSASYQATLDALAAAGAQPGDVVHGFGHSQGGMVVSHLAMGSDYEVRTHVTAGNPVEPVLPANVLNVQIRHSDDPVSALSGGGLAVGSGSAASFLVQRQAEESGAPIGDIPAHGLHLYRETAGFVDDSGDPRVQSLEQLWAELGTAITVESTAYRAEVIDEP